jgi:opacity protein-like surface antigen
MIFLRNLHGGSLLRRMLRGRSLFLGPVMGLLVGLIPGLARAQAKDAAHQNLHIEVFAMGSYYRPNYADTGNTAAGITGGIASDWRIGHFRAGGEVRGSYTTYDYMSQNLISVGPRLTWDIGRFHPYGNFLYGYGTANFKHPSGTYLDNDSTVYAFGGGVDYRLNRQFALRADYERQKWDFDAPKQPFQPDSISLGVRYFVQFGRRTSIE